MKNKHEIRGDVTAIWVSCRGEMKETLIDTDTFHKVRQFPYTWCGRYKKQTNTFYVIATDYRGEKQKTVYLHRYLTDAESGFVVDHINHDTLDNRMSNLRVVTNAENTQNKKGARSDSKTGIRGVTWHKATSKWMAECMVNKKHHYLGLFTDIKEAEKAVLDARVKYMPYSKEAL